MPQPWEFPQDPSPGGGMQPPLQPQPLGGLCPQPCVSPSARWQPRTLTSASNCSAPGLILAHQTVIIGASPALTSLQLVSTAPISAELQAVHRERGHGAPSSAVGAAPGPPSHQRPPSARLCSGAAPGGSAMGGEGALPTIAPSQAGSNGLHPNSCQFRTPPAQAKQGWRGSTQLCTACSCSCYPCALLMQKAEHPLCMQ